jgi:hypothetical protein
MKKRCSSSWMTFCFIGLLVSTCPAQSEHRGIVIDATTRHLVVAGGLTSANVAVAERDPRVMMQLQLHQRHDDAPQRPLTDIPALIGDYSESAEPASSIKVQGKAESLPAAAPTVDWSVPLGTGALGAHKWPAKYGFYVDQTPDCVNDYVVFALNVAGVTAGQANVVGINQLYSGTSPSYCGRTTPHVNWAYNGSSAGGATLGSPTLSLDGTKIVYVEVTPSSSILHVLTWKAGQGTSATHAAKPTLVGACTATSSCLTSLTYSSTSTTSLSFVYVDYSTDKGYVASDDGNIYRISCVFTCALNANPAVDWVFALPVAGTGGALPIPTTPVYDGSKYVFVADQLGEVWSIDVSGTAPVLAAGPVMVGGGGCATANPPGRTGGTISQPCTATGGSYGIPDGTMIVTWGPSGDEVFVTSGNNGVSGASAVLEELNYDLEVQATAPIGIGSYDNTTTNVDLYLGDFDNTFINGDSALGHYFQCGTGKTEASSTQPWDYWVGFTNYPVMNSTPTQAEYVNLPVSGAACTELEEFYNPNIDLNPPTDTDHDMLLGGVIDPTYGPLILDDISNGSITTPLVFPTPMFPGGVSQFVVDNTSTDAQASNWYFTTLTSISGFTGCSSNACAVKVHQSTLE